MAEDNSFRRLTLTVDLPSEIYNALVERYDKDNVVLDMEWRCKVQLQKLYKLMQDDKTILERAKGMRSRFAAEPKQPDGK